MVVVLVVDRLAAPGEDPAVRLPPPRPRYFRSIVRKLKAAKAMSNKEPMSTEEIAAFKAEMSKAGADADNAPPSFEAPCSLQLSEFWSSALGMFWLGVFCGPYTKESAQLAETTPTAYFE